MIAPRTPLPAPPVLRVSIGSAAPPREFTTPFSIGRSEECEVCLRNDYVSRRHAEVVFLENCWRVRDLHSSNGIYLDGERVEEVPIRGATTIRLGIRGPEISLEVTNTAPAPLPSANDTKVARYVEHYFSDAEKGSVGEHTMYIRRAFAEVQAKEKRRYNWIVAGLALLAAAVAAYALYEHHEVQKQRALAEGLFYAMKSLDVEIAGLERVVLESNSRAGSEAVERARLRRREMERNYDQFLAGLHVYERKMPEQDRLVLRVARIFGECELEMPPQFLAEIHNYIAKWQSSPRLRNGLRLAKENGYIERISQALLDQDLPPHYLYLALQESNFDPYSSGPMTRKGIAKGMWQFVPETAIKYGLHLGPLVEFRRPDPGDDRHHFDRETKAAARYLKDLYTTDAQASGLLVMACYNWGEDQVLPLVRSMPLNPRERNFWQLLSKHRQKIPQETYDYVFYITSAAVIGENPRLFGFDFDSPLGALEDRR